jgi:PAS domain S-box-containing protein
MEAASAKQPRRLRSANRTEGAAPLADMNTDQVAAKHALAESEERFRATFANVAVGIAHVAADGRWLRVNKALSRILGWPADELITKSFQEITHQDDLALELAQLEGLSDGKVDSYSVDNRTLRKNGTLVWIRRTVSCARESAGTIDYFVSVVEDISAQKHAEEQFHLLMREARHRLKNILGIVLAIARQTTAREPYRSAVFTERIRALAATQDLLIRSEWRGTDVEDLVRAQLAHLADFFEYRITMRGPKLHLNAAAAQAVGLAFHELATNAGKYGALSTDAGRIEVSWRVAGDTFAMSWIESGGPPVRPPEHQGFGTTVIGTMVKRTLGGEVQLDYAPSGLAWRLTCPAGALAPRAAFAGYSMFGTSTAEHPSQFVAGKAPMLRCVHTMRSIIVNSAAFSPDAPMFQGHFPMTEGCRRQLRPRRTARGGSQSPSHVSSRVRKSASFRILGAANRTTGNIKHQESVEDSTQCFRKEPSLMKGKLAMAAAVAEVRPA